MIKGLRHLLCCESQCVPDSQLRKPIITKDTVADNKLMHKAEKVDRQKFSFSQKIRTWGHSMKGSSFRRDDRNSFFSKCIMNLWNTAEDVVRISNLSIFKRRLDNRGKQVKKTIMDSLWRVWASVAGSQQQKAVAFMPCLGHRSPWNGNIKQTENWNKQI